MPLVDPSTLGAGITPAGFDPIRSQVERPSNSEIWESAFAYENVLRGASDIAARQGFEDDDDPDAWLEQTDFFNTPYFERHRDLFVGVRSTAEAQAIMAQIDREDHHRDVLARGGGMSVLATLAAGVASPTMLIPVGGWLGAVRAGTKIGRGLRGFLGAAAGGGAAVAIDEAVLQTAQLTRSTSETIFNVAGGALLTGVLGGAIALVGRNELRDLAKTMSSIPGTRMDEQRLFEALEEAAVGAQRTDAERGDGTVAPAFGLERALAQQGPQPRLQVSPIEASRQVVRDLAEAPQRLAENERGIASVEGGAVETRMKTVYEPALVRALRTIDEQFSDYYYGRKKRLAGFRSEASRLLGRGGDRLSLTQFRRAVFDAMLEGDVSDIAQVQNAARSAREQFNLLRDRAIEARVPGFKEAVQRFEEAGLDSGYVYRVWKTEAILADKSRFIDILSQHFVAEQKSAMQRIAALEREAGERDFEIGMAQERQVSEVQSFAQRQRELTQARREAQREATDAGKALRATERAREATEQRLTREFDREQNAIYRAMLKDLKRGRPAEKAPDILEFIRRQGYVKRFDRDAIGQAVRRASRSGELQQVIDGSKRANIIRNDGMDLDDMLTLAIEHGYFNEGATLDDIVDAIDQTLKGNPRYSELDSDIVARQQEIDAILDELDAAGLDINKMSVKELREFFAGGALESPVAVRIDNPGGEWLAEKVRLADERAATADTNSISGRRLSGAVTASLKDGPILADPDALSRIEGALGENPQPGMESFDRLLAEVQRDGQINDAILIGVNHRGEAFVLEGNHRIAVARQLGIPVPTEVRWFNGGETAAGEFSPENVGRLVWREASDTPRPKAPRSPEIQEIGTRLEEVAARFDEATLRLEDMDAAVQAAEAFSPEVRATARSLRATMREAKKEARRLRKQAEKLHARADLSPAEVRSLAEETTDTLLGLNKSTRLMTPGDVAATPRGPLKERTLMVPTHLVREFVEDDIEVLLRMATRTMSADIELQRMFGSVDLAEQVAKVRDNGNTMIRRLKELPPAERPRTTEREIHKQVERDIRDIEGIRDRLRGTYGLPDNVEGMAYRTGRVLRNLNYMRLLGGMTISAFPDVGKLVFEHGLTRSLRMITNPFVHGTRAIALAAKEVKAAGTALDMVLDSRVMAMADIMDGMGRGNMFERGLGAATQKFGVVSLMAPWNASLKQLAGIMTQTRMLQAIEAVAKGKASKKQITYLAEGGINARMAERIYQHFNTHGQRHGGSGGVWVANTEAWRAADGSADRQAIEAFRAHLVREVDRTIVTPGQERSLWMSKPMGQMIAQFKSFAVGSMQRTLMSGLQRHDMAVLNGTMVMIGLGMLSYWVKQQIAGREVSDNPAKWVTEGLDFSGLLGWLVEANNISEKLTGGRVGLSAFTGERASRYASRNLMGALFGPSWDIVGDVAQISRAMTTGEWAPSDVTAFRKLLPWQNLFYIRRLFDAAEQGVQDALGLTAGESRRLY